MCGIVGYVGPQQAAPILLDGLSKLEYRGYDSAGLAVYDEENHDFQVVKAVGKLKNLEEKTDDGRAMRGVCGIGHTRWATHGAPTEINAHPHVSGSIKGSGSGNVSCEVVGIHNGIIENYQELKVKLEGHGYKFYSDTDTEVAIKLVDYYYKKYKIGPVDAIAKTMVRVRGSYSFVLMFLDHPGEIWVARKDSPLIIGVGEGETFAASDIPALLKYTNKVCYINNLEMARLTTDGVTFYDLNGDAFTKGPVEINMTAEAAEKGGYEHFMMKEIHEQPRAVRDTLAQVVRDGRIDLSAMGIADEDIKNISGICFVACGSAWHVGMAAQYVMEDLAKLPVRVELASEFRYRKPVLDPKTLVIIISQSGETADSLAALREAKKDGLKTLAIVNVVGSSIAREADMVFYTQAGPEIAVATTKAYSTQLVSTYAIALHFGLVRGVLDEESYLAYIKEILTIPDKITTVIEEKDRLQWFASRLANVHDVFFLGRGIDYAIALEGSLKMKEISYIHSEAYAAGELKHGTISLIEPDTTVIALATQDELYEKTLSNMAECRSRGAYLMGITSNGHFGMEDSADFVIYIPKIDPHFIGSVAVVPLQLLGYYAALVKGLDVDKPRNLAKSVTVE